MCVRFRSGKGGQLLVCCKREKDVIREGRTVMLTGADPMSANAGIACVFFTFDEHLAGLTPW